MNEIELRAWDRRPSETDKAFIAFQTYVGLDPYGEGDQKRSLPNTAKALNLASSSGVAAWSTENDWVSRAAAYDAWVGVKLLQVKETDLKNYQQGTINTLSIQLAAVNKIINKTMKGMMTSDYDVDLNDFERLMRIIRIKDDLARRIGRMPTQFTTERADDEDTETRVFTIGAS